MEREYLVRAALDLLLDPISLAYEGEDEDEERELSRSATQFGDFTMAPTPCAQGTFREKLGDDNEPPHKHGEGSCSGFPYSTFYVDFKISVPDPEDGPQLESHDRYVNQLAEDKISQLKALFKLFRPGYFTLTADHVWLLDEEPKRKWRTELETLLLKMRRWGRRTDEDDEDDEDDEHSAEIGWPVYQEREKEIRTPDVLWLDHARSGDCYDLRAGEMDSFVSFFTKYWPPLQKAWEDRRVVFDRFGTSYERRSDTDRFIDLMIALEAIFSETGETSYKVAARCASFIYPPGEARQEHFKKIRKLFAQRNNILHGHMAKGLSNGVAPLFEDDVRRSIVKLLDHLKAGRQLKPEHFDQYFLRPWKYSP